MDTLDAIKIAVGGIGMLLAIAAAGLSFWAAAQAKSEQLVVQLWFAAILTSIRNSRWSRLPTVAITYGLYGFLSLVAIPYTLAFYFFPILCVLAPLVRVTTESAAFYYGAGLTFKRLPVLVAISAVGLCASIGLLRRLLQSGRSPWYRSSAAGEETMKGEGALALLLVVIYLFALVSWWRTFTIAPLSIVVLMSIVLVPPAGSTLAIISTSVFMMFRGHKKLPTAPDGRTKVVPHGILLPWFAIGVSFVMTLTSLLLGHILHPASYVPQTAQMLLANLIFDTVTIALTVRLFVHAIDRSQIPASDAAPKYGIATTLYSVAKRVFSTPSPPRRWSVGTLLGLDVAVACICACLSLWFGLLRTDHMLTWSEVVRVLLGRSPDGMQWDFGPYFWTMHTTFLPILLYTFVVLVTAFAKALFAPTQWFFAKAGDRDVNAIGLTARLVGVVAVIFGGLAFCLDVIQRVVK